MSYILEALKRAEQERKLGAVPDLQTVSPTQAEQRDAGSRKRWAIPALLTIIVIMSVALLLQLTKFERTPAPTAPTPSPVMADAAPASRAGPATAPAAAVTSDAPAVAKPEASPTTPDVAASTQASTQPASPTPAPLPASSSRASEAARPAPSTPGSSQASTTALALQPPKSTAPKAKDAGKENGAAKEAAPSLAVAESSVPDIHQLPASTRSELPPLTIGGYLYATSPADRTILINNKLLHEGDNIAGDLNIESLGPKSAVLRLHGTRFRINYQDAK